MVVPLCFQAYMLTVICRVLRFTANGSPSHTLSSSSKHYNLFYSNQKFDMEFFGITRVMRILNTDVLCPSHFKIVVDLLRHANISLLGIYHWYNAHHHRQRKIILIRGHLLPYIVKSVFTLRLVIYVVENSFPQ